MSLRLLLLAACASVALLTWHGLDPRGLALPSARLAGVLLWPLALCALSGSLLTFRSTLWNRRWRAFWALALLGLWLALRLPSLFEILGGLTAPGLLALEALRDVLVPTGLLGGYIWLLLRCDDRVSKPLALLLPFLLTALALVAPEVAQMAWLPLLAGLGMAGQGTRDPDWEGAVGEALETASFHSVAWGLILSLAGFTVEAMHGRVFSALFMLFGTGMGCWIGSGLLWGASQAARDGRLPVARAGALLTGFGAVRPAE